MIKRLRRRVITMTMLSLFILLSVIVVGMNALNFHFLSSEADDIIELISQNKGRFPDNGAIHGGKLPPHISPELPDELRYFTALADADGNIVRTDTGRTSSVTAETAAEYAKQALILGKENGFMSRFRFAVTEDERGTFVIFLDCGRKLDSFHTFLFTSMIMSLAGLLIAFFAILFFSGKIIRPIAESYAKQKRFITDAGHEIKTPLTIINANADLLELETGENECIDDIKQQAQRLTKLTNDLITLARMEEDERPMQMTEFPVSEVVADAAAPFKKLAQAQKKELLLDVSPMLAMRGNVQAIEQLVAILLDNALKYSPPESAVKLKLEKQNKNICLSVFNESAIEIKKEKLDLLFERFYRTDTSRNSATGGHGIGLSLARAAVNAHGGKIFASSADGRSFTVTAVFPI